MVGETGSLSTCQPVSPRTLAPRSFPLYLSRSAVSPRPVMRRSTGFTDAADLVVHRSRANAPSEVLTLDSHACTFVIIGRTAKREGLSPSSLLHCSAQLDTASVSSTRQVYTLYCIIFCSPLRGHAGWQSARRAEREILDVAGLPRDISENDAAASGHACRFPGSRWRHVFPDLSLCTVSLLPVSSNELRENGLELSVLICCTACRRVYCRVVKRNRYRVVLHCY